MKLLQGIGIAVVLALLSCNSSNDQTSKSVSGTDKAIATASPAEVNIINQILPNVADTFSFRYFKKNIEQLKGNGIDTNHPAIGVYDKMENIYDWQANILNELKTLNGHLKQHTTAEFENLFQSNRKDTLQKLIPVSQLQAGRFQCRAYSDPNIRNVVGTVSHMKVSRLLFADPLGIGIVAITTGNNIKSGKTSVIFLEKLSGKWTIAFDPVVERW